MTAPRHIALLVADMHSGGAQRQVAFLARQWAARGDDVTVLTYEAPGAVPFFDLPDNVRYRPLGLARESGGVFGAIRANFVRVKAVRRALAEVKPDYLLTFLADMTVTGYMAAGPLGIPVYACERTDPAIYPTGIWRPMRDLVYPRCAKIICQHSAAAAYFGPQAKTVVIPNPVSPPDAAQPSDIELPGRPFIAALGRLSREKGHDVLIEAFATLAPLYPDIDLVIIGDGPAREPLGHLIDALELGGRVHLPGASRTPFAALAAARLFVLPSRFEGFPNALVEAMAIGLPCIATRFSGVEDIIQDGKNGVLVPVGDVAAMAGMMAQLLENKDEANALGQAAQAVANDFNPDRIIKLWDQTLK
jgi:GalNAc-alpha-(1->4)-GalNAc-alpha-(1->3)-diNAcBac-PP-undecaprenol alpha-1,4-N-acetyl-D-galactosaminyltransferase